MATLERSFLTLVGFARTVLSAIIMKYSRQAERMRPGGYFNKISGGFGEKMFNIITSAIPAAAPNHYYELDGLYVWLDPTSVPTAEQLDQKIVCAEYNGGNESELLEWAKNARQVAYDHDVPFNVTVVFANYDALDDLEISRLITAFDRVGALFSDFPDNSPNFQKAVEVYNQEIKRSFNINRRYEEQRRRCKDHLHTEIERRLA